MSSNQLSASDVQSLEYFVGGHSLREWRLPSRNLECAYQAYVREEAALARLILALLPCVVCLSTPLWAERFFDAPDRLGEVLQVIEFFIIVPLFAVLAGMQWRRPGAELTEWMLLTCFLILSLLVEVMRHYGSGYGWRLEPLLTVTMPISVIALARIRIARMLGFSLAYLLLIVSGELLYGNPLYDRTASSWLAELLLLGIMLIAYLHAQYAQRKSWAYATISRAQANTDPLTGLPNRRALDLKFAQAQAALQQPSTISLIAVDLDHFKRINDRHGHAHGDSVLIAVAHRLQQFAQRPLDAVARLGGDEFVILLPECDAASAQLIGEHLIDSVRALAIPHRDSQHGIVTLSAGIVSAPPKVPLSELCRLADAALYRAKSGGRNQLCNSAQAKAEVMSRTSISA